MDPSIVDLFAGAATILLLGFACFVVYLRAGPTLPKRHRLRALLFLMSLPLVALAMVVTSNPLPLALSLVQVAWPTGPSG